MHALPKRQMQGPRVAVTVDGLKCEPRCISGFHRHAGQLKISASHAVDILGACAQGYQLFQAGRNPVWRLDVGALFDRVRQNQMQYICKGVGQIEAGPVKHQDNRFEIIG
ncbi:MAG TPA: hypothetical protein DF282_08925 [Hyphomonas sp.]|nr:hypothetical protein [Hyphomonas sp.]